MLVNGQTDNRARATRVVRIVFEPASPYLVPFRDARLARATTRA
jgi:hypothetical protein